MPTGVEIPWQSRKRATAIFLLVLSLLFLAGCRTVHRSNGSTAHQLEDHTNVHELHYVRHKRVAALPLLKRLETGSVLKGSRAIKPRSGTTNLIGRRTSKSGKVDIDWSVRAVLQPDSSEDSRILEILDDAAELAELLDLLPGAKARIDLVFVGPDVNLKVAHIDYYLHRPTFGFHFSQEQAIEESLLVALGAVMHELVHYRTAFDKRYQGAADPVMSEEVAAYAAGQCASVWLSRNGGYSMSIRRAAVPSRETLLADYEEYGEGHAGRLLADGLIFSAYTEGVQHEVQADDVQGIMERCREVVAAGRGVDLQFVDERPVLRVLRAQ